MTQPPVKTADNYWAISLSTIVLNSRDWYEIIWLPEILRYKNQLCNKFYLKNQLECINDAVPWLNEATS